MAFHQQSMLVPSDRDYLETKRIKIKGIELPAPLNELAAWIDSTYDVHVLNIRTDTVEPDSRPRLQVILETESDARKFLDQDFLNFDRHEATKVLARYEELLAQHGKYSNVDGWFAVFSSFESVARVEANQSIPEKDIERLEESLDNEDLWAIRRNFDGVTFFFHTDKQARKYEADGLRSVYEKEYAALLRQHDEFGYLEKRGISVSFDSKENFDTNYQSNWFYYDR